MKDILLTLKEAYLRRVSKLSKEEILDSNILVGLCFISTYSLSYDDRILFDRYLNRYKTEQKIFYNYKGEETFENDQFLWNPRDIQARLNWLDKQISKF